MDSPSTLNETNIVATVSSQLVTPIKVASPVPVVATKMVKPSQPSQVQQRTIRIHVNTTDQPRPVIFNYRQLYKRELKKYESALEPVIAPVSAVESADDLFYKELLKKAESYAMDDDDVDDDGSDDEGLAVGNKKQIGNEYDFEDPFIDDSEMMLDEPQEYSAPEFDGFFVYHGPLDGHEAAEKNKPAAPKRKAPSKAKTTTSTTSTATNKRGGGGNAGGEKPRKKTTDDGEDSGSSNKKSTPASTSSTTNNNASKAKKPSTTTNTTTITSANSSAMNNANSAKSSTTATNSDKSKSSAAASSSSTTTAPVNRKFTTTNDQPAKKRKKMDTKETDNNNNKDHAKSVAFSPSLSVHDEPEKKKKTGPPELKPLDPEIEALMAKLRRDVVHEDFENKAKFPLALKPTVLEAGLIMLRKMKEIDENLVYHLMTILPYNRFTLKKFLTTKSGQMRVDELQQEIDELAILLKRTVDKMMPEQQRLFDEKLAHSQASNEPANLDGEPPQPKFKCNDEVRKILYDIIQSEEQSTYIANQVAIHKDTERKNEGLASDGKARKLMYQRLLSCWPEGWMNSYEMSRQYSQYKLKVTPSSEKKTNNSSSNSTNASSAATAGAPTFSSSEAKKRKRVAPSDEGLRKKQAIIDSGVTPPDSSIIVQKNKSIPQQSSIITIDDDDEQEEAVKQNSWKKANSMKIEALISGPTSSSKKAD